MKKIIHAFLVYSISFSLLAQDCGSVKEGTVVRLDDEGKPLHKAKVQDQDGIGSCYANTASIMLQGSLPDSPDVSYLHLGLKNGEKFNTTKPGSFAFSQSIDPEATARLVKEDEEKKKNDRNYLAPTKPLVAYRDDLLLESGSVCQIINSARDSGGVCHRKDVPLENVIFNAEAGHFTDGLAIQKSVLTSVSKYYDEVNLAFNSHKLKTPAPSNGSTDVPKPRFLSPEVKAEIQTTVESVGKKVGNFLTDLGKSFKNFFSSIFNHSGRHEPAPVEDRSIGQQDPKPVPPTPPVVIDPDKDITAPVDYDPKPQPIPNPIVIEKDEKGPDQLTDSLQKKPVVNTEPELTEAEILALKPDPAPPRVPTFTREKFEKLKRLRRPLTPKENYQLSLYQLLQKKANTYTQDNCSRLDPVNSLAVTNNIAALLYNEYKAGKHNYINRELSNLIYSSTTTTGAGKTEVVQFIINDKFMNMINNQYLVSFTKTPPPASGKEAYVKAVKSIMSKDISDKNIEYILNKIDPAVSNLLEEDYKRYVKKDFSGCIQDRMTYLKYDDGFVKDFKADPCLSQYGKIGDSLQDMILSLDKSNVKDFEKISDALLNAPDLGYEKALTEALAPTCTEENKVKIPKDLNCEYKLVNLTSVHFRDAPPLNQFEKEQLANAPKIFREDMLASIGRNNTPVGVSVCTIFFQENPSYNYHKTQKCDVTRDNGLHAINVIGYRCNKGKMDYLVQNSWGEWRDLNKSLERDPKFGKAWLSEEAMILNTIDYAVIKKK